MTVVARSISKMFGTFPALRDVDLAANAGEIHALLGANGSGKSTMAKILAGVHQPSAGTLTIAGRDLPGLASPHQANERGIAVVHQEAPLVDTLSVAECMALFRGYPMGAGRIAWGQLHRETAFMLDRYEVAVDPRTIAGRLSPAERALVTLVIALDRVKGGLELLVLDEVTAALPESQAEIFLDRAAAIARSGVAVVMVTHRLAELHGRANRVTVLRNGEVVHAGPAGDLDDDGLVLAMTGERSSAATGERQAPVKSDNLRHLWTLAGSVRAGPNGMSAGTMQPPALLLDKVCGSFLQDLTFRIMPGEIVGMAGLVESGITELPALLGGMVSREGGVISIAGRELPQHATPADTVAAGVTVLPADRLRNGGIGTLSVSDNVTLPDFGRWWHRRTREKAVLNHLTGMLDIRPPRPGAMFGTLSGGNQQKVLLGKWLVLAPAVLVLDDPTQGVDPDAREKIFATVREAAAEGVGVLIFSTEPEQLARLCARVLILKGGRVDSELRGRDLTRQTITERCYA